MKSASLNRVGSWMAGVVIAMAAFEVMQADVDFALKAGAMASATSPTAVSLENTQPLWAQLGSVARADSRSSVQSTRLDFDVEDTAPLPPPSPTSLVDYTFD